MSTVTEQGKSESSYTPYVRADNGIFYIFVSELASHTYNMLNNQKGSILFIQQESESKNLFARENVLYLNI